MSVESNSQVSDNNIRSALPQSSEYTRIQTKLNTSIKNLSEKIEKKLNTEGSFFNMHNRIANFFHKARVKNLEKINNSLSCENKTLNPLTKEEKEGLSWSVKHDYKKILKLKKSLSEIKSEPVSPEESVAQSQEEKMEPKLSEKKFQELWKQVKLEGENNGRGSFGTVYSVWDEASGKDYIIKVPNLFSQLSKHKSSDPEFFASVKGDIVSTTQEEEKGNIALRKGMESLNDSQVFYKEGIGFITGFCGMFEVDGLPVLVYEKAEGKDFNKYLAGTSCAKDNVSERCAVLAQMGHAIAISHEACVINRDIKPENLMVHVEAVNRNPEDSSSKEDEIIQTKLIDQGLAYDLKNPDEKNATAIDKGSKLYLAPEMLNEENGVKKNGVSPAADVYAYGLTIVQTLTSDEFWKEQVDISGQDKLRDFYLTVRCEGTLFKNLSQENFLIKQRNSGKIPDFYSDEQCNFLQGLLSDCLNPNPAKRPSAAQVAELLQLFSSSLEGNGGNGEIMSYVDAKKIVELDRPKAIPIAIRNMIFSEDEAISKQGLAALDALVKADPSYVNTPSYGLVKIKEGKDAYKNWCEKNLEAAQKLKDWTYVDGHTPDTNQSIPVSENVYDVIHADKY